MSHKTGGAVYDSAALRLPAAVRELQELLRSYDLLSILVLSSIKTRYKRSSLGVVWTLLNPLLQMTVLTIAFSSLFRSSLERYPIYLLTGLVCWNFFSQSTTLAMHSLLWGAGLLKRVYMPRTIFVVSAIANGLINLGLSLIPLLEIVLFLGHPVYPAWGFLPVAVLLSAAFSLGLSLILSVLAVFFSDVVELYQSLLQILLYLTPIIYPKEIIPARFAGFFELNPLYHLIELFRAPIYSGQLPSLRTILLAAVFSISTLLIGWWTFTGKADEIAYRV